MQNLFEIANEKWLSIPTVDVLATIDSMPHRIQAVIKAKGGSTKY